MTTPNFTPDVPQWCYNAAVAWQRNGGKNWQGNWHREIEGLPEFIAKHAPKPEATPAPAATDAGEVRYACSKLAAVGDTVKFAGKGTSREYAVTHVNQETGMCELLDMDGKANFAQARASSLEFVPEIPPAAKATVWPRYFRVRENSEWRWVQHKPELPLLYKKYDGGMTPSENTIDEILMRHDVIETDASGNALPNSPEIPDSSPSREWIGKMADGEDKCASVSARNPDAIEPHPGVADMIEIEASLSALPTIPEARAADVAEPKQEASGVERYKVPTDYIDTTKTKGYQHTEVVTAADHDRVVREKDATIAELRADRQYCFDQMKASDTRAEAAEAKCAEYRNTFTAANEMRLSEVRLRHQVQQRADALTAQLAAVNERIRETYAILCQLDNVYRRQSTESVGSFGVSQEVHSLLKRAMDTLNKKDVNP